MVEQGGTATHGTNMTAATPAADLDIAGALAALRRHARMIASAAGLTGLLALAAVNVVSPRYAGEVRVVIENRETALTRASAERANGQEEAVKLDPEAISSQVQIAYSRDLARAVIQDLKLTGLTEFNPLASATGIIPSALGFIGLGRDIARLSPEERALDAYFDRLTVAPLDKSRVIEIRFWSTDPERASMIANAIAERFIEFQSRAKLDRDRKVRRYFERKIDELRSSVADAEAKVEQRRGEFDLLTGANNLTLSSQSLTELTAQLSAAQGQQAEAEARANSIRALLKSGKPIESAEIFGSPLMQRLTERGAALRAEQALQSTVLLPGHPRMRELQAQLADNQAQVRAQGERIVRGLENDARGAADRVTAIQQALNEKKRSTNSQSDKEVQLRALEREAKAQRDLLEDWLALYRDAAARDSLEVRVADARVVSRAEANNTPIFPKKLPIVLIAIFGVLVCGAAGVVAHALMSATADAMEVPPIRAEPLLIDPDDKQDVVETETDRAEGEAMAVEAEDAATDAAARIGAGEVEWEEDLQEERRFIDTQQTRPPGLALFAAKLVLVVSVSDQRKEALLAVELALGLAARGRRVVVVDTQAGTDTIAAEFGIKLHYGLSDIAAGRASISQAIEAVPRAGVHLLGEFLADSRALDFTMPHLSRALEALAISYDSIVLRTGSLLQAREIVRNAGGAATIAIESPSADDPMAQSAKRSLTLPGVGDVLVLSRAREARRRVA